MTPIHPLQARSNYLNWMRRNHPQYYGAVMNYAARNAPLTLGDTASEQSNPTSVANQSWWEKVVDGATKLGTAYLGYKQQRDLNKINLERAKLGQDPLETSDYQTGINVGLSPSTRDLLLYAGLGLIGVLLVKKLA